MSRSLQLELAHTHVGAELLVSQPQPSEMLHLRTLYRPHKDILQPFLTLVTASHKYNQLKGWFHSLDQMNVPSAQRADASPEKWFQDSQVLWNTEVKGHTLELKCMCGLKNEC